MTGRSEEQSGDDLPRSMVNCDGRTFESEIDLFVEQLSSLTNEQRCRYRAKNAQAIAQLDHGCVLIVSGPGSGKSHLFSERIRYWLPRNDKYSVYVASFVRKLIRDLESELDAKLSDDDRSRVTVSTLHHLARSLVERNHGATSLELRRDTSVITQRWQSMVWNDVLAFHPGLRRELYPWCSLQRQFHTLELKSTEPWTGLHSTFGELRKFYNAIGFADMITLAAEAIEQNPSLATHTHWIIDEFQDFNKAEDRLIRALTNGSEGLVMAGDDEQALYQRLKASSPDIIIAYYGDNEFAKAMLPYCSRCSYYVCLGASAFIAADRPKGAIRKVYLPVEVNQDAVKVQVVATAAPNTAVDYIEKFLSSHKGELESYKAKMQAGEESDPYLLILSPDREARFYRPKADKKIREVVSRWSDIRIGHSQDYFTVLDFYRVATNRHDNFAVRKVLDIHGVTSAQAHELLETALQSGTNLADLEDGSIRRALDDAAAVEEIVNAGVHPQQMVAALSKIFSISEPVRLAEEFETDPIRGGASVDEGDEAIETAGACRPVEFMTIVGSKGLSARHVIVIGCDDVNLAYTTRLAFFVGLTRARESLHLIASAKAGGATRPHRFLLDLPREYCEYIVHKTAGDDVLNGPDQLVERFEQWIRVKKRGVQSQTPGLQRSARRDTK
jgi:hypothetical protein